MKNYLSLDVSFAHNALGHRNVRVIRVIEKQKKGKVPGMISLPIPPLFLEHTILSRVFFRTHLSVIFC